MCFYIILFEGVSVTHVILAPGACGREGPTCRPCHHIVRIRWIRWKDGLNYPSKMTPQILYAGAVLESPTPLNPRAHRSKSTP